MAGRDKERDRGHAHRPNESKPVQAASAELARPRPSLVQHLLAHRSSEVIQAVALRPERGSAIEGYLPVGHQQALGDVEAIIGAGIGGEGAPGGYFSRSRVHRVDFAREVPDFLPFTVILVNGSFFGKSVVITRR